MAKKEFVGVSRKWRIRYGIEAEQDVKQRSMSDVVADGRDVRERPSVVEIVEGSGRFG